MKSTTVMWIVLLAVLFVAAAFATRGQGHRILARWMPAMHGGQ